MICSIIWVYFDDLASFETPEVMFFKHLAVQFWEMLSLRKFPCVLFSIFCDTSKRFPQCIHP